MKFAIVFCFAYMIFLCIMAYQAQSTFSIFCYGVGIGIMIGTIIQLIGRGVA